MTKPSYVVAHDPRRPEAVGAVVSEPKLMHKGAALGAVFLPLESELLRQLPLGGFVRRSWGEEGWAFNLNRSEGGSPLAIQIRAGDSRLHWAAEVTAMPQQPGSRFTPRGKLQLALVRTAVGVLAPGFSQVEQPEPFELKPEQRLVLRGCVQINSLLDGLIAIRLWGVCGAVAVRWIAVSQSSANA